MSEAIMALSKAKRGRRDGSPAMRRGVAVFTLLVGLQFLAVAGTADGIKRDALETREAAALAEMRARLADLPAQAGHVAGLPRVGQGRDGALLGARVYRNDGSPLTRFGDLPHLDAFFDPLREDTFRRSLRAGTAMDVLWSPNRLASPHAVLARIDLSTVTDRFKAEIRFRLVLAALIAAIAGVITALVVRRSSAHGIAAPAGND